MTNRSRSTTMFHVWLFVFQLMTASSLSLSSKPSCSGHDHGSATPSIDTTRRNLLASASTVAVLTAATQPAHAYNNQRSRSEGYAVQKSETEWQSILTPMQYNILREGGTERPYYSILESDDRPGIFSCAGCGTDLFESSQKFHSGTGWVSVWYFM
jgi:hypothetical protein